MLAGSKQIACWHISWKLIVKNIRVKQYWHLFCKSCAFIPLINTSLVPGLWERTGFFFFLDHLGCYKLNEKCLCGITFVFFFYVMGIFLPFSSNLLKIRTCFTWSALPRSMSLWSFWITQIYHCYRLWCTIITEEIRVYSF